MTALWRNVPNILTTLRLLLIPVFVILMIEPSPAMLRAAVYVFIIAALTDYVDGMLARRLCLISNLGKLLDPVADKLLVMSALVMLVAQKAEANGEPWVPAWMVVLVLAREIWVTGLRAVAASEGKVMAAGNAGKWKNFLQMVAIVALLLHDGLCCSFLGLRITWQFVGLNLLMISIFFSVWGAVDYTLEVFVSKKREHQAPTVAANPIQTAQPGQN